MNQQQPKTQREMMNQLWFAVIGSNGEGIAATVRRNEEAIGKIQRQIPTFQTIAETRSKRRWARDWALGLAMGLLAGLPGWLVLIGGAS